MSKSQRALLLLFCALSVYVPGCGKKLPVNGPGPAKEVQIVKTTAVSGFDQDAEPQIHHMSDGSLVVAFEFMPPTFVPDEDAAGIARFEDFDKQLERAGGSPVIWEDREQFIIRNPQSDTAENIKRFLENYRNAQQP